MTSFRNSLTEFRCFTNAFAVDIQVEPPPAIWILQQPAEYAEGQVYRTGDGFPLMIGCGPSQFFDGELSMYETAQMSFYLPNKQEWGGKLYELVRDIAGCHDSGDRVILSAHQDIAMLPYGANGFKERGTYRHFFRGVIHALTNKVAITIQ